MVIRPMKVRFRQRVVPLMAVGAVCSVTHAPPLGSPPVTVAKPSRLKVNAVMLLLAVNVS